MSDASSNIERIKTMKIKTEKADIKKPDIKKAKIVKRKNKKAKNKKRKISSKQNTERQKEKHFAYTGGPNWFNFMDFQGAVRRNKIKYSSRKGVFPIRFLIDQPEGMPCSIETIEHINKLNEKELKIFLRGYMENTDGTQTELKRRLAIALGFPLIEIDYTFKPNEVNFISSDNTINEIHINDSKTKPIDYVIFGGNSWMNQRQKAIESYRNQDDYYIDRKRIIPIPFIIPQPEGMPRYLREMDDIIKLNEEEVKLYLRGYTESTDGTINELKWRLALSVGFPKKEVNLTFGYFEPQYVHSEDEKPTSDDEENDQDEDQDEDGQDEDEDEDEDEDDQDETEDEDEDEEEEEEEEDEEPADPNYKLKEPSEYLYIGGPDWYNVFDFKNAVQSNTHFYSYREHVFPIKFLIDQPGGMPCHIEVIEDIMRLNEDQLRTFLRGYMENTDGNLIDLKRRLATAVGFPWYILKYIDEVYADHDTRSNLRLPIDEVRDKPFDYVFFGGNNPVNRRQKGCESYGNRSDYIDRKRITPIAFIVAQPEGMPRYIREMEDIIKLNEEEVKIFLRGYTESTEGKINELKRRLALSVGFPKDAVEGVFPLEVGQFERLTITQ
jgi:hypothetical protein